jgi:hypothetical protein
VKSGIETILHKGSGLLEKAKEEVGGHSEASRSKELGKLHSFRVALKEKGLQLATFHELSCIELMWSLSMFYFRKDSTSCTFVLVQFNFHVRYSSCSANYIKIIEDMK